MSSVDSEELDAADGGDVIYLEKGAVPEAVVSGLAERFPERPPQLVPPMPDWLGALLSGWDLRRHEVNLFSAVDPAFIKSAAARRVVVPEKTFTERVRKRKAVVARDGFWTVSASQVKRAKHLAQYDAKEFSTFNDEEEEIKEKEREKVEVGTRTRLSQDSLVLIQ